jgi:hypothetical protein
MLLSTKFVDVMGNILNAGDIAALRSCGSMRWDSLLNASRPAEQARQPLCPHVITALLEERRCTERCAARPGGRAGGSPALSFAGITTRQAP